MNDLLSKDYPPTVLDFPVRFEETTTGPEPTLAQLVYDYYAKFASPEVAKAYTTRYYEQIFGAEKFLVDIVDSIYQLAGPVENTQEQEKTEKAEGNEGATDVTLLQKIEELEAQLADANNEVEELNVQLNEKSLDFLLANEENDRLRSVFESSLDALDKRLDSLEKYVEEPR